VLLLFPRPITFRESERQAKVPRSQFELAGQANQGRREEEEEVVQVGEETDTAKTSVMTQPRKWTAKANVKRL
jgi:hypothetical protein